MSQVSIGDTQQNMVGGGGKARWGSVYLTKDTLIGDKMKVCLVCRGWEMSLGVRTLETKKRVNVIGLQSPRRAKSRKNLGTQKSKGSSTKPFFKKPVQIMLPILICEVGYFF